MVEAPEVLGTLLGAATERLRRSGVERADREARWIWDAVAGRGAMIPTSRATVDAAVARQFEAAIERRLAGEPLAYVTGVAGFRRLLLGSDRRALIPRPETEGLIDLALARVRTGVAADIGTGTGAIALALRSEGGFDEVVGVDISAEALALARDNGARSGCHVTWIEGDLVGPLAGRMVDLLVSNPPYLSNADVAALDRSVADHEPRAALWGGVTGMELTARLLRQGRGVVRPGGWVVIEIDARRSDAAREAATVAGWHEVTLHEDLFGRVRYLSARQGEPG